MPEDSPAPAVQDKKLQRPITNLFDVLSIDFSGTFPLSASGSKYVLICVKHLTWWTIARATSGPTPETVIGFAVKEIVRPFRPSKTISSDEAYGLTAKVHEGFMLDKLNGWKTVLAYAPMSNGMSERMIATVKKCVGRIVLSNPSDWPTDVPQCLFGYPRRPPSGDV